MYNKLLHSYLIKKITQVKNIPFTVKYMIEYYLNENLY
jgi:hypothetical protein